MAAIPEEDKFIPNNVKTARVLTMFEIPAIIIPIAGTNFLK